MPLCVIICPTTLADCMLWDMLACGEEMSKKSNCFLINLGKVMNQFSNNTYTFKMSVIILCIAFGVDVNLNLRFYFEGRFFPYDFLDILSI